MGLEHRPYIGSWQLGSRRLVQHTPDTLVYINGDMALPGCAKCNGRINIQKFVTQVSVDAGVDPAGASANVTLSVPTHHTDSFARDAQFILRPGLEVHIYMRGYFPVKGLYSQLGESSGMVGGNPPGAPPDPKKKDTKPPVSANPDPVTPASPVPGAAQNSSVGVDKDGTSNLQLTWDGWVEQFGPAVKQIAKDRFPGDAVASQSFYFTALMHSYHAMGGKLQTGFHNIFGQSHDVPTKYGDIGPDGEIKYNSYDSAINHFADQYGSPVGHAMLVAGPASAAVYAGHNTFNGVREIPGYTLVTGGMFAAINVPESNNPFTSLVNGDYGRPGGPPIPWQVTAVLSQLAGTEDLPTLADGLPARYSASVVDKLIDAFMSLPDSGFKTWDPYAGGHLIKEDDDQAVSPRVSEEEGTVHDRREMEDVASTQIRGPDPDATQASWAPSMLDDAGLTNRDIDHLLAYPYYHVFHGVVTQVSSAWSPGTQSYTLNCASMLHFWEYHRVSTNASIFGAKPQNSQLRSTFQGHNFTGKHPYEIMYYLHNDTAGSAAGVSWALAQKTNQAARSEITGESLFSLNLKYWEKRFASRQIKLRMHGASGELFNTAQAVFLGQSSTEVLTSILRNRFITGSPRKGTPMAAAVSLGLLDHRKLEALIQSRRSQLGNPNAKGPQFELSIPQMIPFVKDIGQIGTVQLFESTYESKMDMAQKVCQVTGFEFYQDVDGDFVFKPPMYNMDTSSSRVYRLEDIDIMSFNFDEKEPQATYITMKGSQMPVHGVGLDNEWGVQGQYIDFRLVAQFGWRPADYETAFINDPKSMFFAAVNRLDILNAPCKSASVTIPIRPELRPGYPVYVAHLDCFYYCNSFAHSFTAGGQCTTTLQLIAKRAKFYAPGNPKQEGIEAIRLDYTSYPQRPLEVLDNAGRPRLAGFPNVVMALDPTELNPAFFLVGSEIDLINTREALKGLLKMAVDLRVVQPPSPGEPWYKMAVDEHRDATFYLRDETTAGTVFPSKAVDLLAASQRFVKAQQDVLEHRKKQQKQFDKLDDERGALIQAMKAHEADPKKSVPKGAESKLKKIKAGQAKINATLEKAIDTLDAELLDGTDQGLALMVALIKHTGSQYFQSGDVKAAYGDPNSTALLLDMLSDKKAVMTNGHLPGSYRYYSASHPQPEQQGQRTFKKDTTQGTTTFQNPLLDPVWQGQSIEGFLPTNQIVTPLGAPPTEAMLGSMTPEWGLKVLTNNPLFPGGEVVPTSEIRELMFAAHQVTATGKKGSSKKHVDVPDLSPAFSTALADSAKAATTGKTGITVSLDALLADWMGELDANITLAGKESVKAASVIRVGAGGHSKGSTSTDSGGTDDGSATDENTADEALTSAGETIQHSEALDRLEAAKSVLAKLESVLGAKSGSTVIQANSKGTIRGAAATPQQIEEIKSHLRNAQQAVRDAEKALGDADRKAAASNKEKHAFAEMYKAQMGHPSKTYLQSKVVAWNKAVKEKAKVEAEQGQSTEPENASEPKPKAGAPEPKPKAKSGQVTTKTIKIGNVPPLNHVTVPGTIPLFGGTITTNKSWDDFHFSDQPEGQTEAFPNAQNVTTVQAREEAARQYAFIMVGQIKSIRSEWVNQMVAAGISRGIASRIAHEFNKALSGLYGVASRGKSKVKESVSYPHETTVYGPVFPVSDALGYEVIGSYRYGRDVGIEPGGVFDVLASQDPLSLLDRKTIEDFVASAIRHKDVWADRPDPKIKGRIKRQKLTPEQGATEANRRALEELRNKHQLTDKQILEFGLAKGDSGPLDFDLGNWIADKSKDGVFKIPLINAGYSLADLAPPGNQGICSCKAAEADTVINVAGRNAFVRVTPTGGDGPSDDAFPDGTVLANQVSLDWRQSQDAMRGASPDRHSSTLVSTFQEFANHNPFDAVKDELKNRKAAVIEAAKKLEW